MSFQPPLPRSAWVARVPSGSRRRRRPSWDDTINSLPSGCQAVQSGSDLTCTITSLWPASSTAMTSPVDQSEKYKRSSCHRGDSTRPRPASSVRTSFILTRRVSRRLDGSAAAGAWHGRANSTSLARRRGGCSSPDIFDVVDGRGVCLIGCAAAFPRADVGGIPVVPVVLRGGCLIPRVVFLRLFQKVCQGRNVHGSVLPVRLNGRSPAHASTPRTPVTVITLISETAGG